MRNPCAPGPSMPDRLSWRYPAPAPRFPCRSASRWISSPATYPGRSRHSCSLSTSRDEEPLVGTLAAASVRMQGSLGHPSGRPPRASPSHLPFLCPSRSVILRLAVAALFPDAPCAFPATRPTCFACSKAASRSWPPPRTPRRGCSSVGRGSPTRPTPGKPARGRSNDPQSPLGWFNSLGTRLLFRHALVKATSHTPNLGVAECCVRLNRYRLT